VEAAARGYFGKSAADLGIADAALLAALVRSPSADAPCVAPARATRRRNLVLALMARQARITPAQLAEALRAGLPGPSHRDQAAGIAASAAGTGLYFEEEVRRQLFQMFGADRVLRGGLRVFSTYDPDMQREAERSVSSRIEQIARSRKSARDLQGSLVAMSPKTGEVYAIVGGRDFSKSSFNRATQARRQPGSAFKPIIYAAALERGYAPGTLLKDLDTPIPDIQDTWLPGGDHERSEYTLRRALKVSSNRAAAQLLQQVGVTTAVYYAQRLGIGSRLPLVPSLALGTGEVTLLELTAAYSAFANDGAVAAPRTITRVEDASGETLWVADQRRTQAISATTAYLMSSMLADVVSSGTGTQARAAGFTLPAGGKTGTTDDYADAWFIGYTPHLLTGVWFGLDQPAPIMRNGFGGVVAVPAWASFMRAATKGAKPDWYRMPSGVEKVTVCRLSGERAGPECREPHPMPGPALAAHEDGRLAVASIGGGAAVPVRTPADEPPADEPPVYEDLFPAGAIPPGTCALHDASRALTTALATDAVEHALASAVPSSPGREIRGGSSRLVVAREPRADGSYRTVVREQQH
jgi:penicillin-binding protein 1A